MTDVLTHLDSSLRVARIEAAAVFDRVRALEDLRALAHDFAGRVGVSTLTVAQLHQAPSSPEERAKLDSLVERAIPKRAMTRTLTTNGGPL